MSKDREAYEKVCDAKGCGVMLLYAKDTDGRTLPLDLEPEQRYALSKNGQVGHLVPTYTHHFAICPDAGWWRKRQRDAAAAEGDG